MTVYEIVGGVILLIILLACLLANFIVPEEMVTAYDTQAKLQAPSAAHPFGTDLAGEPARKADPN